MKKSTKPTPKKRRDWRTPFLAALRQAPNVSGAAKAAGIDRTIAYDTYRADPAFAAAWDDAIEQSVDRAVKELYRRAIDGVEKPVTVAGEREVIREYSDTLLIFLLKSHRREVYGDKVEHSGPKGRDLFPLADVVEALRRARELTRE